MLLALIGGALGLGLALAGGQLVAASGLLPDWVSVAPKPSMLGTALALSLFAGALFGALPILSRREPQAQGGMLRESGRLASGGRGARLTRNALVDGPARARGRAARERGPLAAELRAISSSRIRASTAPAC